MWLPLLDYAGSHRGLTFLGPGPVGGVHGAEHGTIICFWLAARDLIAVAPDWTAAQSVTRYGWLAFGTAFGGIVLYFGGLMCTHLAAFRTAANIRKQGRGPCDERPSGLVRRQRLRPSSGGRLDAAAAVTETLLAHNLADIVGTITLYIAMLVADVRL